MSQTTKNIQLLLNDGNGNFSPIGTGAFSTAAVNIQDQRRLSLTIGMGGSVPTNSTVPGPLGYTGSNPTGTLAGGFTGVLLIQTTNELGQSAGWTGTAAAGSPQQPGVNGWTGARFWNTISPSGTVNITNATTQLQIDFTDIGAAWLRVVFNQPNPVNIQTGAGGSGTMQLYMNAKAT